MNAAQLMTDLTRLGIRVEAHGDRLRYFPRSAVTPDLADRMKTHKGELLAVLRGDPVPPAIDRTNATAVWQAALGRLEGDPLFPPDEMRALRAADAHWANGPVAGEAGEAVDPPDPCPRCGTLEQWQTLAGTWRCLRCDPPTAGPRQRSIASRLRLTPQGTGATSDTPDGLGRHGRREFRRDDPGAFPARCDSMRTPRVRLPVRVNHLAGRADPRGAVGVTQLLAVQAAS